MVSGAGKGSKQVPQSLRPTTLQALFGDGEHLGEWSREGNEVACQKFLAGPDDVQFRQPQSHSSRGITPKGQAVLVADGGEEQV